MKSWQDHLEHLVPVNPELLERLGIYSIGKKVNRHWTPSPTPTKKVAFIYLNELGHPNLYDELRRKLYSMQWQNWNIELFDLGDLMPGNEELDTQFLIKKITQGLISENCVLAFVGGNSSWGYHIYRSFDHFDSLVNFAGIDNQFALNNDDALLEKGNFLSHIIRNPPNNLLSYTHLGQQAFYTAPEELDLLEQINFESLNLGELIADLSEAEPMLRTVDVAQLSLNALESKSFSKQVTPKPNGFNSREVCALSRYVGISAKLRAFCVSDYVADKMDENSDELLAQILWYFLSGLDFRPDVHEFSDLNTFVKINVPQNDIDLVFYKNQKTQQWWLEAKLEEGSDNTNESFVVPCSERDYRLSLEGQLPDRYWKTYKRFY